MGTAVLTANLVYTPPGGAVGSASAPLSVSAPYTAESIGIMDIPDATPSGTEFLIPFGTIGEATFLAIKNTNNQDMGVRLNTAVGVADEYQLPSGGVLIIDHPALAAGNPLSSAAVVTTVALQSGVGTIQYFVFGD